MQISRRSCSLYLLNDHVNCEHGIICYAAMVFLYPTQLHSPVSTLRLSLYLLTPAIFPFRNSFFRGGGGYRRQEADLNICTTVYNQIYNWEMEK